MDNTSVSSYDLIDKLVEMMSNRKMFPNLTRIVRSFFSRDLPVACVCHGIEILAAAGVLRGRTVTTVAKCQFDAEGGGATYVDRDVVVAGNLVTARTWHDNAPFMREFLKEHPEIAISSQSSPLPERQETARAGVVTTTPTPIVQARVTTGSSRFTSRVST